MPGPRKSMFAAGRKLPESVRQGIAAESLRQASADTERARFVRWAEKGWRWEDARPFTDLARRGFEYGRKLRAEYEEVRRYGPGPLHGLFKGAVDLARAIGSAQGAYRGGIE